MKKKEMSENEQEEDGSNEDVKNLWEKACWKQIRDRKEEEWSKGKREKEGNGKRELLEEVGLSIKEWNNSLQREEDKIEELLERLEREEKEEIRKI